MSRFDQWKGAVTQDYPRDIIGDPRVDAIRAGAERAKEQIAQVVGSASTMLSIGVDFVSYVGGELGDAVKGRRDNS